MLNKGSNPMTHIIRLRPIILVAFLVLMLGSANALAADTFEENLTAPGTISLDVDTGSGSIEVTSGSGRDITVVGTVKIQKRGILSRRPDNADELIQAVLDNPPVEFEGDTLKVGYIKDRSIRKHVSISFEIVVPADTPVRADSGSGSVVVTDMAASVSADTGSGSIKLTNIKGNVSGDTGSGSIELSNIDGAVTADTGSGSIVAEGVAGKFHGDTGSGSITLAQTAPGDVNVDTGSGSIKLTGIVGALKADSGSGRIDVQGEQAGDWNLDSGSGSISVTLPDDAAFDLDAETNSGGIRVAEHFSFDGTSSKKHMKGAVNGGGPRLRIETSSGGIRVQ